MSFLISAPSGEDLDRYLVYHLDVHTPSLRLLTTIVKPSRCREFTFKSGLLVIGWEANGSYFLNIRKVSCSPNEPEEEVILNLGSVVVRLSLKSMISTQI
jgi:hypothetical protein